MCRDKKNDLRTCFKSSVILCSKFSNYTHIKVPKLVEERFTVDEIACAGHVPLSGN